MWTHIETTSCDIGSIVECVYCGGCLEMGLLYWWLRIEGLFTESFPRNGLHVKIFFKFSPNFYFFSLSCRCERNRKIWLTVTSICILCYESILNTSKLVDTLTLCFETAEPPSINQCGNWSSLAKSLEKCGFQIFIICVVHFSQKSSKTSFTFKQQNAQWNKVLDWREVQMMSDGENFSLAEVRRELSLEAIKMC
jgi:hypothetical protein